MLRVLTREQVKEKLKGFETTGELGKPNGILLWIPYKKEFCAISFGDGTNAGELEEGCDDYIYIATYEFDDPGFTDEIGGGQLDFNSETSGYNGDITNVVYDALKFVYDIDDLYDKVPDFIPLQNFLH